jgi:hypothetical protein
MLHGYEFVTSPGTHIRMFYAMWKKDAYGRMDTEYDILD